MLDNLQITWTKPVKKGVGYIAAGKFIPAFGWGFWFYRRDIVSTVNYSSITDSLAARSNGIEVGGILNRLEWKLGAFSGERIGGNMPESDFGKWDFYFRTRLTILAKNLWVGSSMRLGPKNAWGLDMQVETPFIPMRVEAEAVHTSGHTQYSLLSVYRALPWLDGVLRFEHLDEFARFTPGLNLKKSISLNGQANLELRFNFLISSKDGLEAFMAQGIVRF